jgi:hypothetical protein
LTLVVASLAINKRRMYFKVIDSPYRVEILSPEAEANAGVPDYCIHQERGGEEMLVCRITASSYIGKEKGKKRVSQQPLITLYT